MHRLLILLLLLSFYSKGQNTFKGFFRDSQTKEALIGVTAVVSNTFSGSSSNQDGFVEILNIPNGYQKIKFNLLGYDSDSLAITFPLNKDSIFQINLKSSQLELEGVVISSTRTGSRIEDLPMKVEVLGLEDMQEENTIKPGNIASILGDFSIIHIQQTSSVSGNSVVRMQGLDGKYTQLLRDGLPLYEGFSGGFGVLQIPPLDLKQIEIIKGSASTLYGGGAIAGLINIISKEPSDSAEGTFTLNQTSLKETNINGYFSKKKDKLGVTLFAGSTFQEAVDVNHDGFSDVPKVRHGQIHPTLFYYFNPSTSLRAGLSSIIETRTGGDMKVINQTADSLHSYFESNDVSRNTVDIQFTTGANSDKIFTLKSTASLYKQKLSGNNLYFPARQITSYSEASYLYKIGKNSVVAGVNYISEAFTKESGVDTTLIPDFYYRTLGVFAQNGWQISEKLLLESGARADYHSRYHWFVLPRVAFLYKMLNNLSFRVSSGMGYKTPDIFNESFEGNLKNIEPLATAVLPEKSIGINMDINYHSVLFDKISLQVNQAFYHTEIENSLIATFNQSNRIMYSNAAFKIESKGTDTYLRLGYENIELYLGYNHTISQGNITNEPVLFSPNDKFSYTVSYEVEKKWRIGIESSLIANQYTSKNVKAPDYWFYAAMIERKFNHINFVLNCENIFDSRQSKKESIVLGSFNRPIFKPLWGPIDGRVVNLSLLIKI